MNKDEYINIFKKHGLTDITYLNAHLERFLFTQKIFHERWPHSKPGRLLDIGAHWLHQAILYATKGFSVTAADFPITIKEPSVQSLAKEYNIALYPYDDLSTGNSLTGLPDDSFDVIIFSEIIEHITFNPVPMWRELYRLLAPGGRIVVTTPNYYYVRGRAWSLKRFVSGRGGGITVAEIVHQNTYGHHWKEYSGKEIVEYFYRLSKDFNVSRLVYIRGKSVGDTETPKFVELMENFAPPLRKNLYVEIDLPSKTHGIEITPSW